MTVESAGSCPDCGKGFVLRQGDDPRPGDLTFCIDCGVALTWDEDMILQKSETPLTPEERRIQRTLIALLRGRS